MLHNKWVPPQTRQNVEWYKHHFMTDEQVEFVDWLETRNEPAEFRPGIALGMMRRTLSRLMKEADRIPPDAVQERLTILVEIRELIRLMDSLASCAS